MRARKQARTHVVCVCGAALRSRASVLRTTKHYVGKGSPIQTRYSSRYEIFGTLLGKIIAVTERTAYTNATLGKFETQLGMTRTCCTEYVHRRNRPTLRVVRSSKISEDLLNIFNIPKNTKFGMNLLNVFRRQLQCYKMCIRDSV